MPNFKPCCCSINALHLTVKISLLQNFFAYLEQGILHSSGLSSHSGRYSLSNASSFSPVNSLLHVFGKVLRFVEGNILN